VRPLPDACLPLCARYLIATAIDPLSLIPLSTWKTVLAGFTTAARPIAGFASGYRDRGVFVAAAAGCDRPRSGRPPGAAVSQALRVGRFCACFAVGRRLRQRLQGTRCLCSRCRRLRSAAKRSSSRRRGFSGICALAGFASASQPGAGFASGYRVRGVFVAAAAGCDRPRSGRPPGAAVSQALRVGRFCVCFAAERRLRQRLQGSRRPGCGAPGSQWQVSRQPGSRRWPALVSEFDPWGQL